MGDDYSKKYSPDAKDDPRPKDPSVKSGNDSISFLTKENPTKSNAIEVPSISLPKGGGALRSIDEKFQVNALNGTAGFSIPLPVTPGRNNFSPGLSLSYNSGSGNSPYGLGWDISIPSIQRRTDKKLPRYRDALEEDVFTFSGEEDLVPYLTQNSGAWSVKITTGPNYSVKRYRPRIESAFSKIEKITHDIHGVYWKITTRENIVTILGRDTLYRIADPADDTKIFKWFPEFSYDNKGNYISYVYKEDRNEKKAEQDAIPSAPHENNRKNGNALFINRYLKNIQYGNHLPYYPDAANPFDPKAPADKTHFFELVMDYGEHDNDYPEITENPLLPWKYRDDAFSSYRSGFEIRTARLCKRILMFHLFDELGDSPCLVRSLDLTHSTVEESGIAEVTYLELITQNGYIRKSASSYSKKSFPPIQFNYQALTWEKEIKTISTENLANAPVGLTGNYQWADLYGEGISGILTEQGNGLYYKNNLSNSGDLPGVLFSHAKLFAPKPSFTGLNSGFLQLADLNANGEKQLVVNDRNTKGYFQLTEENHWEPFRPFPAQTNIDPRDPFLRSIDLNGDGRAELVISEENVFTWFASEGKDGYSPAEYASKTFDEEKGPAIVFSDPLHTIYLADMTGDGLTDIVRIRNGEICYWANLGYGRFSAKINMSNAPLFDLPGQFNPALLQLADVSGTGTTDLVYIGKNRCNAWLNLAGNAWSDKQEIESFPSINSIGKLSVIDLLGTGTSCIVWSSDLDKDANTPMRYINLMNSTKPHVMTGYLNNFGKEVTIQYKSSTHFYNKDKIEGRPWATKLAFPVQVVAKTITSEKITSVRFTTEYRYHHGYYDHTEREFRGFGMVEQQDTENYEVWNPAFTTYQPPVLTKTWFHTGAYFNKSKLLAAYETEYWYNEMKRQGFPVAVAEPTLPDLIIPPGLSNDEKRESFRAFKGGMIRQEIFALDGMNPLQLTPYSVTTHNYQTQLIQPRATNIYEVFLTTETESLKIDYERNTDDPRIVHTLNTVIDELGNITEKASVAYGRITANSVAAFNQLSLNISDFGADPQLQSAFTNNIAAAIKNQQKTPILYALSSYTKDLPPSDLNYRLRQSAGEQSFELTGLLPAGTLFTINDFNNILSDSVTIKIEYHDKPDLTKKQRRLIENIQILYYTEDLTGSLPFKQLASHGLVFENYQLSLTPQMITDIFGAKIPNPDASLPAAGYIHNSDTNWWIRSGSIQYLKPGDTLTNAQTRFYTPCTYTDPLGTITTPGYYRDYFLMIQSIEDNAFHNTVKADNFNFRTISPSTLRDLNDNLSTILTDELGLVKATALLGKDTNNDGNADTDLCDNLNGITEITDDPERTAIDAFFLLEDSNGIIPVAKNFLQGATTRFIYDLEQYKNLGKPTAVATIAREQHNAENPNAKIQCRYEYSDGLGKVAMIKIPAEPGMAKKFSKAADGTVTVTDVDTSKNPQSLRWIGNGRTVLNNKGNPIKQFEPYFSTSPFYESADELVATGVTPILYYDPPGRNVKTLFPDGSFSTVEFDQWKQLNYDRDDNILLSDWYKFRTDGLHGAYLTALGLDPAKELDAANNASAHDHTPSQTHSDSLGRPIFYLEDNGPDTAGKNQYYTTCINTDIESNILDIRNARGNPVMIFMYDMLGHRIYQHSMDVGERWTLSNVMGKPVSKWDGRNHEFSFIYDGLHRPSSLAVQGGDGDLADPNKLYTYETFTYGEGFPNQPTDKLNNFRGKLIGHADTGGILTFLTYDIKGNLTSGNRQLATKYDETPDWKGGSTASGQKYNTAQSFDALNRVVASTTDDGSISMFMFDVGNQLKTVSVNQNGNNQFFVTDIEYNEKGQRETITHGNGIQTVYNYDKQTFRLIQLTTRESNEKKLQDLYYTYDPVGNITQQEDQCIPKIFFNNYMVDGVSAYNYDALYRLINATGRELIGQLNYDINDNWDDFPFLKSFDPRQSMAWQNYNENYTYDPAGNITQMVHNVTGQGANTGWTRNYVYETFNNCLKTTQIKNSAFIYAYPHHPQHGFITGMPHLSLMKWNFRDELMATAQQVKDGPVPTTYYVYDSQGQRLRKLTTDSSGNITKERIYLGALEYYYEYSGSSTELSRNTLHITDDKQRIALIETLQKKNGEKAYDVLIRYHFNNLLGSSCLEVDDQLNIISYEEYHPFGTTSFQATSKNLHSPKRYRYSKRERDDESGFIYYGKRYYLTWLGRWVSGDPEQLKDGNNLFYFVRNNPVKYVDEIGSNATEPEKSLLSRAQETVISKGNVDVNALLKAPLQNNSKILQTLQIFTDKKLKTHVEQLQLLILTNARPQTEPGDPFEKEGKTFQYFRVTLPDIVNEAKEKYVSELSSHLFHEFLHVVIGRDKILDKDDYKSKTYSEYKKLYDFAKNDKSVEKERLALTSLGINPEHGEKGLEFAVQELYVVRKTVKTFGGDGSNEKVAERYTRATVYALTGLESKKIPMIARSVQAALKNLYDKLPDK